MRQHVHFITLGVADVAASRRFYVDGLGWTPTFENEDVVFVQVAPGVLLALFGAHDLAADIAGGPGVRQHEVGSTMRPAAGVPIALAHNVSSPAEVAQVLAEAAAAGATILKPAQTAAFGGVHGYFADPDGLAWEVAYNPGWSVADDGTVSLTAPA